jgi:hypothetical protein
MKTKRLIRLSTRLYAAMVRLYPKGYRQEFGEEMVYVFSESLEETYLEEGIAGIIYLWTRVVFDTSKTLLAQHLEAQKGVTTMKTRRNDIIMQKKIFFLIAAVTGFILAIPLITMQFTHDVKWSLGDFIIMGILLFGMGSLFVLSARKTSKSRLRVAIGIGYTVALLYMWAELAVGIFTNLGS